MVKNTLYVLDANYMGQYEVAVYAGNGKKLLRTIDLGGSGKGRKGIAIDSKGDLVASLGNTLNIYSNRGAKVIGTLKQTSGFGNITLDSSDNLYTTCERGDVCEYGSLQQKVTRRLKGLRAGYFAVDKSGDLAVQTTVATSSYEIEAFAPGQTEPYWTIPAQSSSINTLAFDQQGDLYIAIGNNIAVYPPNATSPSQTISLSAPASALDFDSSGNLYAISGLGTNKVEVYAPGGGTPIKTLTQDSAVALTIDSSNKLFVANLGVGQSDLGSVSVYQKFKPVMTVTNGIAKPIGVAVAP
jgi:WD40 repeat protein